MRLIEGIALMGNLEAEKTKTSDLKTRLFTAQNDFMHYLLYIISDVISPKLSDLSSFARLSYTRPSSKR